jgi:outer membrane protein W
LTVTSQRSSQFYTTTTPTGVLTTLRYATRAYPIDATVSYHFLNETRWKPYLGAGLRYVSETLRGTIPGGDYRFTTRTVEPEISGGLTFQFTPRLGLRFDAKQVIGRNDRVVADPALKGYVGLSLRF